MTTTGPDLYRNEFTTDDLAEAREFLNRTYVGRLLTASVPPRRSPTRAGPAPRRPRAGAACDARLPPPGVATGPPGAGCRGRRDRGGSRGGRAAGPPEPRRAAWARRPRRGPPRRGLRPRPRGG